MLIQGIMKCGLGNWIDIQEQFVKNKSAKDCENHYFGLVYKSYDPKEPFVYDRVLKRRALDGNHELH